MLEISVEILLSVYEYTVKLLRVPKGTSKLVDKGLYLLLFGGMLPNGVTLYTVQIAITATYFIIILCSALFEQLLKIATKD